MYNGQIIMKRIFTLFAAAVVAVSMFSKTAESGLCGADLTWFFNASTGELKISGTGPMTNYSSENLAPWYDLNDKISRLVLENGVTTVGDYAFYGLINVANDVQIPYGVTSIGKYAFDMCVAMPSVFIPYGVKTIGASAFGVCQKLSEVELPFGVTSIGESVFSFCTKLSRVIIPSTVTTIGDYAFRSCTKMYFIDNLATIPQTININVFEDISKSCYLGVMNYAKDSYKQSVWGAHFDSDHIGVRSAECLIEHTNFLLSMDYEKGILTITGNGVLPDSPFGVGNNTFYKVSSYFFQSQITQLVLPSSMTGIGKDFFKDLYALSSLTIPEGVSIISEGAFANCKLLKTVYNYAMIPQSIDASVFNGVDVSKCTLYVPKGSKPAYEAAAVWKDFIVKEIDPQEAIDQILTDQSQVSSKFLRNGILFIERGGKTYSVSGQEMRIIPLNK